MPFITAKDGAQLYWREWGKGPPILFLSSLGCDSRMWDYQIAAFADEGFRCIGFDRRPDPPPRRLGLRSLPRRRRRARRQPRPRGLSLHPPFDGGRRGGALSPPAWEQARRPPHSSRTDDADAAQGA